MKRSAGVLAALYFVLQIAVLSFGFPHEDAFILFKYANDLACGHGIAFYPGGPHAEGATDFLWMIALAGARSLTLDVALAAAALNAVGFFFAARIFLSRRPRRDVRARAARWVGAILLFASPAAVAGFRGFSAMLYSALALVTLDRLVSASAKKTRDVPLYAILLGLVRPDGVILGAGLTLVAAFRARKIGVLRDLIVRAAIAVVVGMTYFVWRWRYFGSLLPLPLYVKEHYGGLPPGLDVTIDWMESTLAPLTIVAVLARVLLGRLRKRDATRIRALGIGLVPFLVHVASFVPSVPSQNIMNRFEAPAALAILWLVIELLAASRVEKRSSLRIGACAIALVVACFPMFRLARFEYDDAFYGNYPNALSHDLGALTDSSTHIAATEAGRVLYFARGPTLDLVGLNTKETALAPPSRKLLRAFDPDVVMIHPAGSIIEPTIPDDGKDVIHIDDALPAHIPPVVWPLMGDDLPPYDRLKLQNVFVAATATEGFLNDERARYDVYAVRFASRFFHFHLYAIKKDWPKKQALLDAIEKAHRESSAHSYLEFSPWVGAKCVE